MAKKALEGLRIADFTWWGVGPYITKLFGAMGAQVIRIESLHRIDPIRTAHPFKPGQFLGINQSGYWNNFNPCKLSVTLNLSLPKGVEIAKRLIMISDIVADNFTPRVMPKLGLDYEELLKMKPSLILLSMPVMGRGGPRTNFAAFGHQIAGLAGLNSISGFPGRPPSGTGNALSDFGINPYQAATALLAALHHRNKTGEGQFIELAQYEATTCVLETAILDYTMNNRIQGPNANRLPYAAPHGAYRCKGEERWCVIAVFTDEEWTAFCNVLGNPPWTKEERFATLLARKKNEDELDRLVEEWTRERIPEEVMALMQHAGVAAGVVQNTEDLLVRDPQMKAREFYQVREHPEIGTVTYDGLQYKFSATPGEIWRAPLLGEHSEYVYRELLAMSDEEIEQCATEAVFE